MWESVEGTRIGKSATSAVNRVTDRAAAKKQPA